MINDGAFEGRFLNKDFRKTRDAIRIFLVQQMERLYGPAKPNRDARGRFCYGMTEPGRQVESGTRVDLYGDEPIFGKGAIPASGRGMTSLSDGQRARLIASHGHKPSLEAYDRQHFFGATAAQGLYDLAEELDELNS